MSTLSNLVGAASERPAFQTLQYEDVAHSSNVETAIAVSPAQTPPTTGLSEAEVAEKLAHAHRMGCQEAEKRLRSEFEQQISAERERIVETIANFQKERAQYYSNVEAEFVQLALAIAAKILHRESQIDRMLLAGLVKVAIENLQHRSNLVVRVPPQKCDLWREYFALHLPNTKLEILEDSQLQEDDCILETELGTADMSIKAQLKEVETGFFDLLAQRPDTR